jgi:DNA-binding FadR family transcriptional regulator
MHDDFSPIRRERLTDKLAARMLELIRSGAFRAGDRPSAHRAHGA